MKAHKIGNNQVGTRYAIVRKPDGSFSVYVLCANYAGHVRGGIAHTWRLSNDRNNSGQGMTLEQAETLFAKRLAGRRR